MQPDWMVPEPWESDETPRDDKGRFAPQNDKEYHRLYMAERRRRQAGPEWVNAIGGLHDVGCKVRHRKPVRGCTPIPVYAKPQVLR